MRHLFKFAAILLIATSCYYPAADTLADDTADPENVEVLKPCEVCASVRLVPVDTGPEKTEVELSKEQCDDGDYSSCVILQALTFLADQPPETSKQAAFKSFKEGCDQGDLKQCRLVAELYVFGTGVEENRAEAVRLTRSLCDSGFAPSCFDLGRYALYGLLEELDEELALESYAKSCAGDFADGCDALVEDYSRGFSYGEREVTKKEYMQMIALARKSCGLGSAYSCTLLSMVFKTGQPEIVDIDLEKSVSYLDKACTVGDLPACSQLTEMYRIGDGVKEDPVKQFEYRLKFCDHGGARGCALVGSSYKYGEGVERDIQASIKYETKACDMGFVSSCGTIADYYRDGEYVDQDIEKAVRYYKQACDEDASDFCDKTREYVHRIENKLPDPNAPTISKEVTAEFGSAIICAQGFTPNAYDSACTLDGQEAGASNLVFYVEGDEYISINPDSIVIDALAINGADARRDSERGFNFQLRESELTMGADKQPYLPLTIIIREGFTLNSALELRGSVTANYSDSVKEVVSQPINVSNIKSFELGPAKIKGIEFSDLRYGLEYAAKSIHGSTAREVSILEELIKSKGIDFTELGLDISEEEIERLEVSQRQKSIVVELRDAYERLTQRWSGGGSGLDDYDNFNLDISSGARFIKNVFLLDGEEEIEGSDTGYSLDEGNSSYYSFNAPKSDRVRIKIVYWDTPKVAKINLVVTP